MPIDKYFTTSSTAYSIRLSKATGSQLFIYNKINKRRTVYQEQAAVFSRYESEL
jgi:hypothetical protein